MGNIVLLDDLTINKIAAGEVVERPASVVKEMVENSIDAGATKVTVEIKNGGISFIRISDNGKGIAEDDMEIAFERHATSKIRNADDINKVTSMGFRGEALASVAAIANVEMISRTADSSIGHRIVVEGGKVIETSEIGAPIGTTITVKNLFYNTPVRYKFLKKDYTESGYIEDAISRLALVNKNIAFKLINTGKTVIQTNGNNEQKSVIYSIYGKDVAENILEIEREYEGIIVKGVVGKPEIARSNRSNQLFFVNGRYVKDRTLTAAAEQAFKNVIPVNKYGFLVLNIEMDPAILDVNVHPAKLEVRFEDENKVFRAVYSAIKDALILAEEKKNETPAEEENPFKNFKKQEAVIDTLEQKSDEVAKAIMEDELFGKRNKLPFFKKNKEENVKTEEDKDNLLEEVYKFRKGLKEIGVSEVPTSVYTPIFDEDEIEEKLVPEENVRKSDTMPEEIAEEKKQDTVISNVDEVDNKLENENIEKIPEKISNEHLEEGDNTEIEVPSEEKVQEMTDELIKQRESSVILEEAIENSKIENPLKSVDEDFENDQKFDDMYAKIFGEKPAVRQEEYEKVLSENEQRMLDEIKNSVKPVQVSQADEEINEHNMNEKNVNDVKLSTGIENNDVESLNEKEQATVDIDANHNEHEYVQEEKALNTDLIENMEKDTVSGTESEENVAGQLYDPIVEENDSEQLNTLKNIMKQNYKYVGVAFSNYIIVEIDDEMCIIDWKAANERIIFEKLKKDFYSNHKDSQTMLMADVIGLNHRQTELIKDNLELFENAGFSLEAFGENTIKLTVVPNVCIDMNTKHLFLELLDGIDEYPKNGNQNKEDRFIAEIAKKVADVSDIKLSEREVDRVLKELLKFENPYISEDGKRIAVEFGRYELERKFSRK